MKQIPNLFTLLNLVFGCIAVIYVLQDGISLVTQDDGTQLLSTPEKMWYASLFIALAGVVDFLDGFLARLFKATSAMGKQLDSLADVVSFGVAPGLIIYQFMRLSWSKEPDGLEVSMNWLLPALLIPCAAAWRLAKFNIDDSQQYGFRGMPTPAVGLLIASFPLIYWYYGDNEMVSQVLLNKWALYGIVALLALLMVSNLPLIALKFKDFSVKNNLSIIILLVLGIVAVVLLKWLAVPVIFICYIAVSLAFKNKTT